MKKIIFLLLFVSTLTFSQEVYDFTWDGTGVGSNKVNLGQEDVPMALIVPSTMLTRAISFKIAVDSDSTFYTLTDSDTATVSLTIAYGKAIDLDHTVFLGACYSLQIISDSTEVAGTKVKVLTLPVR